VLLEKTELLVLEVPKVSKEFLVLKVSKEFLDLLTRPKFYGALMETFVTQQEKELS
jgi:hypothetical protein